jgi:hypothetical protein
MGRITKALTKDMMDARLAEELAERLSDCNPERVLQYMIDHAPMTLVDVLRRVESESCIVSAPKEITPTDFDKIMERAVEPVDGAEDMRGLIRELLHAGGDPEGIVDVISESFDIPEETVAYHVSEVIND